MFELLFGGKKKLNLIRELVEQRMRSSGFDDFESRLQTKNLSNLVISGTPEAVIVSIIEVTLKLQKKNVLLSEILHAIENHRKRIGSDPYQFNQISKVARSRSTEEASTSVLLYCIYRVGLENPGMPISDVQIAKTFIQATNALSGFNVYPPSVVDDILASLEDEDDEKFLFASSDSTRTTNAEHIEEEFESEEPTQPVESIVSTCSQCSEKSEIYRMVRIDSEYLCEQCNKVRLKAQEERLAREEEERVAREEEERLAREKEEILAREEVERLAREEEERLTREEKEQLGREDEKRLSAPRLAVKESASENRPSFNALPWFVGVVVALILYIGLAQPPNVLPVDWTVYTQDRTNVSLDTNSRLIQVLVPQSYDVLTDASAGLDWRSWALRVLDAEARGVLFAAPMDIEIFLVIPADSPDGLVAMSSSLASSMESVQRWFVSGQYLYLMVHNMHNQPVAVLDLGHSFLPCGSYEKPQRTFRATLGEPLEPHTTMLYRAPISLYSLFSGEDADCLIIDNVYSVN